MTKRDKKRVEVIKKRIKISKMKLKELGKEDRRWEIIVQDAYNNIDQYSADAAADVRCLADDWDRWYNVREELNQIEEDIEEMEDDILEITHR